MINEDVRHILEAELQPGETLLWAERISDTVRDIWIRKNIRESRICALPLLAIGLWIVWSAYCGVANRHPSAELWITVLLSLPIILIGGLILFASHVSLKAFYNVTQFKERRLIKAYALTNKRLLCFEKSGKCLLSLDAHELKKVEIVNYWRFPNKWIPKFLMLSPIGTGVWRFAELHFLPDFEVSKTHINSIISKRITP